MNVGDSYRELGGGVSEVPDDAPPVPDLATVLRGKQQAPSCPLCGDNQRVGPIESPLGQFFCACGTVFDGTTEEWRRCAKRRAAFQERQAEMAINQGDETEKEAGGDP